MDEMKKKFELAEKAIAVLTKVSFGLGSAIFLVYCAKNGGFPDGLSLADSLRIFYIVAAFSAGTLVVYFFLMCLGLSICHLLYRLSGIPWIERMLRWTADGGRVARRKVTELRRGPSEFFRTYKRPRAFIYHVVFPPIAAAFHGVSVLTLIAVIGLVRHDRLSWYVRLVAAAIALGLWFIIFDVNRQRRGQMKFVLPGPDAVKKAEKNIRTGNLTMSLVLPVAVTFILGLFGDSADRTMQILGFRHEQATVYMRGTWSTVLARHGIEGQDAQLAPYVSRYDKVTVALTSFGSSVTLQFHDAGKTYTLRVPAAEVLVDPLAGTPDLQRQKALPGK